MIKPTFIAVLVFGLSGAALANEDPCPNARTQSELNACTAQAYQTADKALNNVYRSYRANLGKETQAGLRKAQRAWIAFRDAECEFQASAVEGGSAQPMVRNGCLAALTRERTEVLKAKTECPEGDLACPR